MKNWCAGLWRKVSFLGLEHVDKDWAYLHSRDIILLNRLVIVLLLTLSSYIPLEIIFNGTDLIPIIAVNFFLISTTLYFNSRKKYDLARWIFLITSIIAVAPLILYSPAETYYPMFMIPVALIPVVIFKEKYKAFIGFLIVTCLYFIAHYYNEEVDDIMVVEESTVILFSYIFKGMLFVILFFLVFYLKNISDEYEGVITVKTNELKESHEIISERNKDITDSINYAKKIQEAYLPNENVLPYHFPESFLLFKPKDIVSGDFYWIYNPENENGIKSDEVFVAVADCTGHGVPGAIMSVICCNALNEAVITKGIRDTGKILDETREIIIRNLKSKGTGDRKDGMDISLVRINKKTKEIQFSGANNPLWYIENNEIKECKADKQPVGMYENMKSFTSHKISNIEYRISNLFLFTDGFADQFGGAKGKKFKYSNLQKLLLENSNLKLSTLNVELENAFDKWKGELEQVDDICIIGIKL